MIKGQGTEECPLESCQLRHMDISIMQCSGNPDDMRVVIIFEDDCQELYAMNFKIDDFREMVDKIKDELYEE